jgi:hypothetical protein
MIAACTKFEVVAVAGNGKENANTATDAGKSAGNANTVEKVSWKVDEKQQISDKGSEDFNELHRSGIVHSQMDLFFILSEGEFLYGRERSMKYTQVFVPYGRSPSQA